MSTPLNLNDLIGVTGSPPPAGVATRSAQVSYYAQVLGALPGTYSGNQKAYDGLTWSALYEKLAAAQPTADPKTLADTVLGIYDTQVVAGNVGASAAGAISTGTSIAKGANAAANQNFGLPQVPQVTDPLAFLGEIGDFFTRLTQLNTWIRIGKILLGGALVLIGLAHMTGAENKVMDAARNVKVLPV